VSYFEHDVLPAAAVGTAGFVGVDDSEDGEGGSVVGLDGLGICGKMGRGGRKRGMRHGKKRGGDRNCQRTIEKEG